MYYIIMRMDDNATSKTVERYGHQTVNTFAHALFAN